MILVDDMDIKIHIDQILYKHHHLGTIYQISYQYILFHLLLVYLSPLFLDIDSSRLNKVNHDGKNDFDFSDQNIWY